jgi:quercetin dioxygenase-like cupin family protein
MRAVGASITFELDQTVVTASCGLVQRRNGHIEEIHTGDVVWFPPVLERSGATATTAMTHIAIQEQLDGKAVVWLEKVSNEQYRVKG